MQQHRLRADQLWSSFAEKTCVSWLNKSQQHALIVKKAMRTAGYISRNVASRMSKMTLSIYSAFMR